MSCVKVVIADSALRQMVRELIDHPPASGAEPPRLLVVELTDEGDCRGSAAVRELRMVQPRLPVIAVSCHNSAAITKQAVRLGVDDYYRLPEERSEFHAAATAFLTGSEPPLRNSRQQNVLLGDSPQIVSLRKYVARVAMTDSSVLITGETGTGKELVAELIHKSGPRRDRAFVCVNSAALPDTLLESELFGFEKGAFTGAYTRFPGRLRMAHGGTIFFDEIGDLSPGAQGKLLRAIESREVYPLGGWRGVSVDVRVIAATNRDLDAVVSTGGFRQDLYYRLNVVRIELPPLRHRRQDIPRLINYFIGTLNRRMNRRVEAIEADALQLLQAYDWPGNVRELRNVVEASFVNATSAHIEVLDLPERLRRILESQLAPDCRERLVQALLTSNWNISRTAHKLHCSRMTVYRKMAQYRIARSCTGDSTRARGAA